MSGGYSYLVFREWRLFLLSKGAVFFIFFKAKAKSDSMADEQQQQAGRGAPAKSRGWCFTENNPTRTNLFPDGLPDSVAYVVYQLERGEAGTPHLQGFIWLKRAQRMAWLRKLEGRTAEGDVFHVFERAHLIASRGNAEQNKTYCTKSEGRLEGPWELGSLPKQGDRTDLAEAAQVLMRTGDIRQVDPGLLLKYASGCLKIAALAPPPRRDDLRVVTIVGPTGIGKSYAVHDLFPDVYVVNMGNSGLWWDGYTGQPAVMFEEFKGQVQLQKMLQILDPYPLRLEIKGGLVPARFTIVFITSNYTPDQWYKNEDGNRDAEMAALRRRVDCGCDSSIPPVRDGPRFIHVETRNQLHHRLNMLKYSGIIPLRNGEDALPVAAAALPSPPPTRPHTPNISDEEEPPRLRRAVAHITVDDAPADADMVTVDGEPYVRDDVLSQHSASFYAPQP